MVNVNDFKPGITFKYENNIYVVIEARHFKFGREQSRVKAKVKNLRTKSIINITFTGGDKVERAAIYKTNAQFLYISKNNVVFMNMDTFEQIEIMLSKLEWEKNFLIREIKVVIIKYRDEVLEVVLPDKIKLKVVYVECAVKGDTISICGATKKAILETGLEIQVPLFIKINEFIIVSTINGKYYGRA